MGNKEFFINIHVEEKGTTYNRNEGSKPTPNYTPSRQGHLWYDVSDASGNVLFEAGFAKNGEIKNVKLDAPGTVVTNDSKAYSGEPYFTARMKINSDQAAALQQIAKDPSIMGFDADYNVFGNSCVDFVWNSLRAVGIRQTLSLDKNFEGALVPIDNIDYLNKMEKLKIIFS